MLLTCLREEVDLEFPSSLLLSPGLWKERGRRRTPTAPIADVLVLAHISGVCPKLVVVNAGALLEPPELHYCFRVL